MTNSSSFEVETNKLTFCYTVSAVREKPFAKKCILSVGLRQFNSGYWFFTSQISCMKIMASGFLLFVMRKFPQGNITNLNIAINCKRYLSYITHTLDASLQFN